ncbi:MAG: Fur family transcriptional regulator [Myxococcota bacterium]
MVLEGGVDAATRNGLRQRLRASGLRATPARLATYEVLWARATPLTHAEVHAVLADQGLERTTVYRNLIDLTEAGLVARTDLGDHTWRFERKAEGQATASHAHFVCVDCGEVSCIDGVHVAVDGAAPRAVASQDVEVQIRGRCDGCADATSSSS